MARGYCDFNIEEAFAITEYKIKAITNYFYNLFIGFNYHYYYYY